jgi:hypothetical protein
MLVTFTVPQLSDHTTVGTRVGVTGCGEPPEAVEGHDVHPGAPCALPEGALLYCRDGTHRWNGSADHAIYLVTGDGLTQMWRQQITDPAASQTIVQAALQELLASHPVPNGLEDVLAHAASVRHGRQNAATHRAGRLLGLAAASHVLGTGPLADLERRSADDRVRGLPRVRYMREEDTRYPYEQDSVHVDLDAGEV